MSKKNISYSHRLVKVFCLYHVWYWFYNYTALLLLCCYYYNRYNRLDWQQSTAIKAYNGERICSIRANAVRGRTIQVAKLATRFFNFPFHVAAPFRRKPPTSNAPFPSTAISTYVYINSGVNDLRRKQHKEEIKNAHKKKRTLSTMRNATPPFF